MEIKLPELGENITGADVAQVLVEPGDKVKKDQPLLEMESEKAFMEFPSPADGTIKEVKIKSGDKIKIGQLLFLMDNESPAGAEEIQKPRTTSSSVEKTIGEKKQSTSKSTTPEPSAASPGTQRLARELGADIHQIGGSGINGHISKDDVMSHIRENSGANKAGEVFNTLPDLAKWGTIRKEDVGAVRRATAKQMTLSWNTIAHVTQFDRANISDVEEFRKSINDKNQNKPRITITSILLKIVSGALRKFEKINASLDIGSDSIIYRDYVHIGVAVDTDRGLLVPILRNADQKGILAIATELDDLSSRARSKKLSTEEMQGASFTITNLGSLGTTYFTPLVNWPQSAVLGVGRANMEPVWNGEIFVPKMILPLSISYDHRLIDGADAARFLRWIAEALERPLSMHL